MFPAVIVPKSSWMAPSMTKTSSSPACRCSGSLERGAIRLMTARRLLSGCSQMFLPRTPGWRSCHGKSLREMICDSGVFVVLIRGSPGSTVRRAGRVTRAAARVNAGVGAAAGDRVAVVELHAPAQHEVVHEAVRRDGPRLGQAGSERLARHRLHDAVVEREQHHE